MSGCCRGVQIKRSAGVALSLSLAVLLVSTPRARAEIDHATVPIDHLLVIYLEPARGTGVQCRVGVEVGCRMVPLSPREIGTQALPGTPDCCVPLAGQRA